MASSDGLPRRIIKVRRDWKSVRTVVPQTRIERHAMTGFTRHGTVDSSRCTITLSPHLPTDKRNTMTNRHAPDWLHSVLEMLWF